MFETGMESLFKIKEKKILLLHGRKSYVSSGAEEWIRPLAANNSIVSFDDFSVNPEINDLMRGIKLFQESQPDIVVAIGGGSVLDMAKMVRFFSEKDLSPDDWIDGKLSYSDEKSCQIPLFAIPTTAGTGAEATHFAVLYREKVKYSIAHEAVLPDKVILIPELTMAMTPFLTAVTGLDAFFQAVEAWWSKGSTEESRQYSEKAIPLILDYLESSVHQGDLLSRKKMLEASYWAGRAINIAKTTACHAFSYIITSTYGYPHGQAVAVTFPFFLEYNLKHMDTILSERLTEILNINGEYDKWAISFINSLGIDNLLHSSSEEVNLLLKKKVDLQRLKNNPILINEDTIESLASCCSVCLEG